MRRQKVSTLLGVLLVLAIVFIAAIAWCAFRVYRFIDYEWEGPHLARFSSPDGTKAAYIVSHGALMGHELTLLISPSDSHDEIRWIGSVSSDDTVRFLDLIWSKDSTLVAARCYVYGYHQLPQDTKDQDRNLLTHGYDFDSSSRFVPENDVLDATPTAWIDRHAHLQQLFAQRGGQVTSVSQSELYGHLKKMTWPEWRLWRDRLKAAREHESK